MGIIEQAELLEKWGASITTDTYTTDEGIDVEVHNVFIDFNEFEIVYNNTVPVNIIRIK